MQADRLAEDVQSVLQIVQVRPAIVHEAPAEIQDKFLGNLPLAQGLLLGSLQRKKTCGQWSLCRRLFQQLPMFYRELNPGVDASNLVRTLGPYSCVLFGPLDQDDWPFVCTAMALIARLFHGCPSGLRW